MRQYNNSDEAQQSPEVESYTWLDAVFLLLKAPSIDTFKRFLNDSKMTPQRAYFWVLIGGVFLGVALASLYRPAELINAMIFALPREATGVYEPDLLIMALAGSIIGSMYAVIGFIIQTWILQRVGKLLGLKGNYRDLVVLRGIYYPILLVFRAVIIATLGITALASSILIFATLFLDVALSALALRATEYKEEMQI